MGVLSTSGSGGIWSTEFHVDLKPVWRMVREHPEAVVLVQMDPGLRVAASREVVPARQQFLA